MGRQALLGVGGPRWSPRSPGNLLAWYDASFGVTESSGAVSQWDDRSGNGYHLTQATGAVRPTYSATGWNSNRPTISFTPLNFLLSTAAGFADYPNGTNTPLTIFAVMNVTDTAAARFFAQWWEDPGVSNFLGCFISTTDNVQFDINGAPRDGAIDADGARMRYQIHRNATLTVLVEGILDTDLDEVDVAGACVGMNKFAMGMNAVGANGFEGQISEMIIYSAKLDFSVGSHFLAYAERKWGGF